MRLLSRINRAKLNKALKKAGRERALRFLNKVYSHLYKRAMALTAKDYCKVKCGSCIEGRTLHQKSFCCGGCKYLINQRCSVEALTCRAWTCQTANAKTTQEIRKQLEELNTLIYGFNFYVFRGTREDSLRKAMIYIFL